MWPRGNLALQLRVYACVVLLVLMRLVNIAVPLLYKQIGKFHPAVGGFINYDVIHISFLTVDALSSSSSTTTSEPTLTLQEEEFHISTEEVPSDVTLVAKNSNSTGSQQDFHWQLICFFMFMKLLQGWCIHAHHIEYRRLHILKCFHSRWRRLSELLAKFLVAGSRSEHSKTNAIEAVYTFAQVKL